MATITTSGSILDIDTLVSGLMTVESRPLTLLANKEASYQAKLSAFGQIKSALSSLQTATTALNTTDKFAATKATVAGEGFTASSNAGAAAGSYSVDVTQMAKIQRVSTATSSSFVPAAGKLTIEFGTVKDDGGTKSFASDAPPRTAALEFTGSTLEELRDAINNDATLGIKANIVNNGTTNQLVFSGTKTGANMAFKLTGEGGLADLSYDPATTPATGDKMYSVQGAQDAILKVDGISITRGNNTISDVIDGVTLTLTKEPTGTATSLSGTLSIAADQSTAKTAVEAFIKAYNEAQSTLKSLTAYNTETETAATLTGDSTARNIQSQLRNAVTATFGGLGSASTLSQIGISFAKDGTLSLDSTKFNKAMSDPAMDVGALFAGTDKVDGFADAFGKKLTSFLDTEGVLASRTKGIDASIKSLTKQYDAMETRLETMEARYRKQFSSLDTLLSGLSQTSSYLSQQLANLPKIGSS